ncbi:killer cell lectin-like receptor subfamily F member 1 isoform X2 [Haemorhous mexicanus]|uniref:killer cell lectin-like receptor subfamily F member 1 isoform X2 n=1 Tax=Haemorhous mexicanus TaxID=30427 RepID=UPI0028BD867F|nr:killer cell lectin-like receptor subfamily F member 1 isoform X2 [Haemorhous mexicanus]
MGAAAGGAFGSIRSGGGTRSLASRRWSSVGNPAQGAISAGVKLYPRLSSQRLCQHSGCLGNQELVCSRQRDGACEQEKSESCPIPGAVNEPQHPQEGPAAGLPHLPGVQEASWHQQGDATCERAVSADVENGSCTRDGSVREPVSPQGTSAANKEDKRNLRRLLAPQVPVPPATPQCVLGCPSGWVGHNGVCYYFSRDYSTWEQAQERCSQLNASLAIAEDEEAMDLLFRLLGNGDFWLGLRRRGERLQWEDGSSYSSRVPVLGNSQCAYLADGNRFRSEFCSNERPYVCSKAQGPL